jgi:SAM-dependent methyltransferase
MSEERRAAPAAVDESSPEGALDSVAARSAQATPSSPPRDAGGARRRLSLRIPDDEIARPIPLTREIPSPRPPRAETDAAQIPQLKPMRIITISEPPAAPPAPASGPDLVGRAPPPPSVPEIPPPRAAAPSDGFDSVEVEVRFEDDVATPPPEAPPPSAVPTPRAAAVPTELLAASVPSTPNLPEPPPTIPGAPPSSPLIESRSSSRSDPPSEAEISSEDLLTLEPPPTRPVAAAPPMRPRAPSQPPVQLPPAPPPVQAQPPAPPAKRPVPPAQRPQLVIVPPQMGNMQSLSPDPAGLRRKSRLWWEDLFNDDYLRTTERVSDEQIAAEVVFIEESLGVEHGGALLDLACGTGRHAIELARRGYEVVGLDLSLAMLARAGDDAQDLGAKLNFVQGDMRDMTFDEQFDGVYCWNTSFGYFEEEKNAQVVDRVHRSLKSGGLFLLDVVNRDFLVRQSPSLAWFEGDGCVCMDEMGVDFITSRLKVKRTMMLDDGRSREIEYSMRIYSLHELGRILHEHGFKVREVSGRIATPGVFFGNESPRAIILAEKR